MAFSTFLLCCACFWVCKSLAGCVPCHIGFVVNGSFHRYYGLKPTDVLESDLGYGLMFEDRTQMTIKYNYSVHSRGLALLGLLSCLTYGLHELEMHGHAQIGVISNRPVVCTDRPFHDDLNTTVHHSVGAWTLHILSPATIKWGTVIICLVAYLIAVT
ncbi:GP4 [Olivier's shrew virus 2]|nr:GP4 [Olivier's shrew virus 2]